MMKHNKGFTLIELMIVVAIIGIIAMFAVPSYQNAQRKARINEGIAQLTAMQSQVEKYRLNHRATYKAIEDAITKDGYTKTLGIDNKVSYSGQQIYTIEYKAAANSANKYTITATVNGTWIPTNDKCGKLDLDGQGNLAQKNYCQK